MYFKIVSSEIAYNLCGVNHKILYQMQEESINEVRRKYAKSLYTNQDYSIEDIALETGADEATVRNWVSDGVWDEMKRSQLTSKKTQMEHIYKLLKVLGAKLDNAEEVSVKDVDLYVKYTAAIKNLEKDTGITNIMLVTGIFFKWLRRRDPELARRVAPYIESFAKYKSSPFNS